MKTFRGLDFDDSTITFLDFEEGIVTFGGTVGEEIDFDKQVIVRISDVEDFIVDNMPVTSYHVNPDNGEAISDNGEIVWITESGNHLSFMMVWVQKIFVPTKSSVFSFRFGSVDIWSSEAVCQIP